MMTLLMVNYLFVSSTAQQYHVPQCRCAELLVIIWMSVLFIYHITIRTQVPRLATLSETKKTQLNKDCVLTSYMFILSSCDVASCDVVSCDVASCDEANVF